MARMRLFLNHNLKRKKRRSKDQMEKKRQKRSLVIFKKKSQTRKRKQVIKSCFIFSLSLSLSLNCPGLTSLIEAYHYCICTGKSRASVVRSLTSNQAFIDPGKPVVLL